MAQSHLNVCRAFACKSITRLVFTLKYARNTTQENVSLVISTFACTFQHFTRIMKVFLRAQEKNSHHHKKF